MKNKQEEHVFVYKLEDADYASLSKEKLSASCFLLSQLDKIIVPGERVVIKPNWVKESHLYKPNEWEYVITHPEVIKLVLEKVIQLLNGNGEIYIVEAPQTDSDYDEIIRRIGLQKLVAELQKTTTVKIVYFDLREERWYYKQGIIVNRKKLKGDPNGYIEVNLKDTSEFYSKANRDYYGADYDMDETRRYHNEQDNIYVISKTVLSADVFINIPKLKTHKLAGITCCLKNLVGTCVIKNSLPHHTLGSPETGGDKFPYASKKHDKENMLKGIALKLLKQKKPFINYPFILIKKLAGYVLGSPQSDVIRNGAWYGNDTIWRTILDLNKILFYTDKNGKICDKPQRKYFAVVDGIIAGEGKGPMEPDPKPIGVLLAGLNPVYIDTVAAALMGFDFRAIPSILNGYKIGRYSLTSQWIKSEDIIVHSNEGWTKNITDIKIDECMKFRPHPGWEKHIETLERQA